MKVRKYFKFVAAFLLIIGLFSCAKKNVVNLDADDVIQIIPSELAQNYEFTKGSVHRGWTKETGVICVFFGWGFNNEDFSSAMIQSLASRFGLSENGGIILPVVFPQDLRNRVSNLYDLIDENNVRGIILLGAPENTHYTLAKIQDDWNENVPFNIFSFFPQDDILGQESNSTLVIDFDRSSLDADEDKHSRISDEELLNILQNSIMCMINEDNLPKEKALFEHAKMICSGRKVSRYVDSESTLVSINHFIIEQ